jgi:hypothetical protein
MEKVLSERHMVIQEEDHPSSYNMKKSLVPLLSTFARRKSVGKEFER